MACFAATLGVTVLSGLFNLLAADSCEHNGAVGQNLTLPFVYNGLDNSHVLRWTHNNKVVFYRERGRVSEGKPADISATGSLLLKNLQFSSAGAYQANVLYPNSTFAKMWTGHLCVMDKVVKPQLTYNCDFKSSSVLLNCHVTNPKGLLFSWVLDEKTLTSETRQKLSISLEQLKGERTFTCSVANKVSKEKSDTVRLACTSPSTPPLLCFKPKTVLAIVLGGAGLILLLLVIVVNLCCCSRRNKTKMRLGHTGELRMLSLSNQEPDAVSREYETMHTTEDSPPLNPETSSRTCYENISQPEALTENRPSHLSTAAEGQQPSPVPKPRTKRPQTPNI